MPDTVLCRPSTTSSGRVLLPAVLPVPRPQVQATKQLTRQQASNMRRVLDNFNLLASGAGFAVNRVLSLEGNLDSALTEAVAGQQIQVGACGGLAGGGMPKARRLTHIGMRNLQRWRARAPGPLALLRVGSLQSHVPRTALALRTADADAQPSLSASHTAALPCPASPRQILGVALPIGLKALPPVLISLLRSCRGATLVYKEPPGGLKPAAGFGPGSAAAGKQEQA